MIRVVYLCVSLLAVVFTVLVSGRETSLECRYEGDLPICTKFVSYFEREIRNTSYFEVGQARIQESCDEDGVCSQAVVISTEARFNPAIEWSDGRAPSQVVDEFNAFLEQGGDNRFNAEYRVSFWRNFFFWLLGLGVALLFGYLWFDDWRRN